MAAPERDTSPGKLNAWLARMGSGDLPILSETNRKIAAVARKDDSTAIELANIVLRDPAMTSQVLRVANTVFYNPSREPINTISRAVVLLGFNAIFSICVSKTLVDSANRQTTSNDAVLGTIVHSLHAAVQARALAEAVGEKDPEDLFIAALLYRLGDIAVWTYAPDDARRIEALIRSRDMTPEAAQREVLGFTGAELTLAMSREWHLSPALERALSPELKNHPQSRLIAAADRLSEHTATGDRDDFNAVAEEVATMLQRPPREAREFLQGNLKKAGELVREYGLKTSLLQAGTSDSPGTPRDTGPTPIATDNRQTLQLQILGEISGMLNERAGMGLLLEMVVEGIYRGVGMERAALMLLGRDRKSLAAKFTLGGEHRGLRDTLQLSLQDTPWLRRLLASGEAAWFEPRERQFQPDALFREAVGQGAFFIMPIGMPQRMIGLIYADRQPSGRALTESDYEAFRLFGQQANLGLTYLEHRSKD